jgi:transglutaminase-like putative cysteine protease
MHLAIEHRFAFEYDGFISESFLELRLQPRSGPGQIVHAFVLSVGPPTRVHRYTDWNENITHHFTVTKFHDRIEVAGESRVETHSGRPGLAALDVPVAADGLPYPLLDFLAFGGPVRLTPRLRELHRAVGVAPDAPLGAHVRAFGDELKRRFEYQKDVTRYDSTTEEFLAIGAGVCQDFAHAMLGLLRLSRIPCRYVSGYLHVERERSEPSQSHAWVEAWSASHGWVAFDPTHGREIDERYVVVGHGRCYDDVPPNKGIYRGDARETLRAEVRTREVPAPTTAQFHEEIRPIDLKVYREMQVRRPDGVVIPAEDMQAQQQQQQ